MKSRSCSVEVTTKSIPGLSDSKGNNIKKMFISDHNIKIHNVKIIHRYDIISNLNSEKIEKTVYDLFSDPIIEHGIANLHILNSDKIFPLQPDLHIHIGFKPGVTDNAGKAALDGLRTIYPELNNSSEVFTSKIYLFWGIPDDVNIDEIADKLYNPMIEHAITTKKEDCLIKRWGILRAPIKTTQPFKSIKTIWNSLAYM